MRECSIPRSAPEFWWRPCPPRSGLNLNKRSQVIRMSRRGEQAEKIAASLNLPQREVELLLKVYGRVVYSSNDINS